jgi:carboxyl-terminal processing protease
VLDLRGNGGGLFETAVDCARRFLPSGVIGTLHTTDPKQPPVKVYQSLNPSALTLPLVVLVDGDTASAAEVLAGALKENRRARLVGQPSYGKGCIQGLMRLRPQPDDTVYPGALRVTVARFYSPTGQPYSGRGVLPHLLVEQPNLDSLGRPDQQLSRAFDEATQLIEVARLNS